MNNPFRVFISFKNSDSSGELTRDMQLAAELHRELSKVGVRTFFSPVSLRDMGKSEYKHAINEALDQANILVVVGTRLEYIVSGWVEYEWTSFHEDIISGRKTTATMLTYVEGIAAGDLPRELRSGYQSINAGTTSAREATEFIVKCASSLAEKNEHATAQNSGSEQMRANIDDELRQKFDELFGRHEGRREHSIHSVNDDPLFALLEESYVNNFVEWMQNGFSHSTKMASLQAGVTHKDNANDDPLELSQDSIEAPVQPVRLLDPNTNPGDDEEFHGKYFTVVDKPNMKTIVYEIYLAIDYATRTQYPSVERTFSSEIEREDGYVERTFYILYTEPVNLVIMTLDPATKHVIVNVGRLGDDGRVKICLSPKPVHLTDPVRKARARHAEGKYAFTGTSHRPHGHRLFRQRHAEVIHNEPQASGHL